MMGSPWGSSTAYTPGELRYSHLSLEFSFSSCPTQEILFSWLAAPKAPGMVPNLELS